MKLCPECEGEGIVIDSQAIEDDISPCDNCEGRGVVGIPTHIYLQLTNLDEITWSDDRIYDNDIEYQLVPTGPAAPEED